MVHLCPDIDGCDKAQGADGTCVESSMHNVKIPLDSQEIENPPVPTGPEPFVQHGLRGYILGCFSLHASCRCVPAPLGQRLTYPRRAVGNPVPKSSIAAALATQLSISIPLFLPLIFPNPAVSNAFSIHASRQPRQGLELAILSFLIGTPG